MSNYNNRDIYFSFKEYQNNYNNSLNAFLSKHEDFDEMNFVENELDLYDLCLENATLTLYTFKGEYKYAINFGNCRFIISKIYDNLVTFKEENDGWDLELALKYQVTFKKIIDYLKKRKELISKTKTEEYNNLISTIKTPEVRELFINILYNDATLINVVNYIRDKTNSKTRDLFISEFNSCCQVIFNEFMFKVKDDDIKDALKIFGNNLEYVYEYEDNLPKINHFVKEINKIKTVWNVYGLSTEKTENSVQLVYLNNMMIDYYDGFFHDPIDGFKNLISLKNVYEHLNKGKVNTVSSSNNDNIEKRKEIKVDITYIGDIFSDNKDILPLSILNAFKNIGNFKHLFISEKDGEILNSYDLGPFDNLPGTLLIEYYCLEENYIDLLSKIEDSSYIFFDNRHLDLYLYEYAKGFQKGYIDFEKYLNQKQTAIEEPLEQKALKIFSYVLNAKYKNGYFGDITENNVAIKDRKGRYISNNEFSEWGFQGGQYYKAWEIILNNPIVFEPFFIKHSQSFLSTNNNNDPFKENDPTINNVLKSTIEDYLEEFKPDINGDGYEILINSLLDYFTNGEFPILEDKIKFKKINKKRVGWALKELYKSEKTDNLDIDYFRFAQENINLFEKEVIDAANFNKSKFYKAFTTNPTK